MLPALDDTQLANLLIKSRPNVFRFFYGRGWVTLCVDATQPNVDVPPHLKSETNLRIRLGINLPLPTTNVRLGSQALKATLFFSGRPYPCVFPWENVLAVIGQEEVGLVWAETKVFLVRKKTTKPTLTVLKGGLDDYGCDEEVEASAQELRSKLFLIKGDKWKSN